MVCMVEYSPVWFGLHEEVVFEMRKAAQLFMLFLHGKHWVGRPSFGAAVLRLEAKWH